MSQLEADDGARGGDPSGLEVSGRRWWRGLSLDDGRLGEVEAQARRERFLREDVRW